MADGFRGFGISSSSKRLKLSRDSYSDVAKNRDHRSQNCQQLNLLGQMEEEIGSRETEHPPNTSPDPLSFALQSRIWPHSNFDDRVGPSGLGVTSTSDELLIQDLDLTNGGDSGFTDLTPPGSAGCAESSGIDTEEPDSSTTNCACPDELVTANTGSESSFDDDDSDEVASTISRLSGLSDMSGQEWNPVSRPMSLVHRQIASGVDPRTLLQTMLPTSAVIPEDIDDITLWKIIIGIVNEPPHRRKLSHVDCLDDVLNLLKSCRKIIVLTGAGVSVSCGIPDFRSKNGIYARLAKDFPDLPDPQAMFDFQYFKKDPRPFYKFAKEIYPGQFDPSPCHRFIKYLEDHNKLLRNYTQNIDTLERVAGINKVIECHGSFATASCIRCKCQVDCSGIKEDVFNQTIPRCPRCTPGNNEQSIMKPDIVFFGEGLSEEFHSTIAADKEECDLLIVIGSSLKVRPVGLIPSSIPPEVPQILINREQLRHINFDVELLGDCDVIISELCHRLGDDWSDICYNSSGLTELQKLPASHIPLETRNDIAESTTEHSNNPCDSTSFPHRSKNKFDDEDCSDSLDGNPDSTNAANVSPHVNPPCAPTANGENSTTQSAPFRCLSSTQIASRLPENTYLFHSLRRYVFHGAEVCESDLESDTESTHDDSTSTEFSDNEADDSVPSPLSSKCNNENSFPPSPDQGIDTNASNDTTSTTCEAAFEFGE